MTRFLFTMNMPSGNDNSVHQVIGDHPAKTCEELMQYLISDGFIIVRQQYVLTVRGDGDDPQTKKSFEDRGEMILNADHIGKVQIYVEKRLYNRRP